MLESIFIKIRRKSKRSALILCILFIGVFPGEYQILLIKRNNNQYVGEERGYYTPRKMGEVK